MVPVIEESSLKQSLGGQNDPFAMGGMFMQGNQNVYSYHPYWMECTKHSVCIVCNSSGNSGFVFSDFDHYQEDKVLCDGFSHFENNDKVYIIVLKEKLMWQDAEEDDRAGSGIWEDSSRKKWNGIVLDFSMDEVRVKLEECAEKEYYKLLYQGTFALRNILVKKGFFISA